MLAVYALLLQLWPICFFFSKIRTNLGGPLVRKLDTISPTFRYKTVIIICYGAFPVQSSSVAVTWAADRQASARRVRNPLAFFWFFSMDVFLVEFHFNSGIRSAFIIGSPVQLFSKWELCCFNFPAIKVWETVIKGMANERFGNLAGGRVIVWLVQKCLRYQSSSP